MKCKGLLDSGSDLDLVRRDLLSEHQQQSLRKGSVIQCPLGKGPTAGQLEMLAEVRDDWGVTRRVRLNFQALDDLQGYDVLLGLPWGIMANPNLYWAKKMWHYRTSDKEQSLLTTKKELPKAAKESEMMRWGSVPS